MVADVSDRAFCNAESKALFDGLSVLTWTVSPSGDTFVAVPSRQPRRLRLVLNWFEELERLVLTEN